MGSIERRVRHLEGLHSRPEEHRSFANPEARARMRAVFAALAEALVCQQERISELERKLEKKGGKRSS